MSLRLNEKKRKSVDSIYIDYLGMNSLAAESKAKSQICLTLLPTPGTGLSNQKSPNAFPNDSKPPKHSLQHKNIQNSSSSSSKNNNTIVNISRSQLPQEDDKATQLSPITISSPRIIKSASSADLVSFKDFDEINPTANVQSIDDVDGPRSSGINNAAVKWNEDLVDIKTTEMMLKLLDEFIKEKRDKISKDESQKDEMVDKLISNFTLNPTDKSSKKMRQEYEATNKNAEKSLEKTKLDLEQLEYKRLIVGRDGIPWDKPPSDFVKSINIKHKHGKGDDESAKKSPRVFGRLFKGYDQKSISVENLTTLNNTEKSKIWNAEVDKFKEEHVKKSRTAEEPINSFLNSSSNSYKNPNSVGTSSINNGDKGTQSKKSKSNSVCSAPGRELLLPSATVTSTRRKSCSVSPAEFGAKGDDWSGSRLQALCDDITTLQDEVHRIRSELDQLQFDTENMRLDIKTSNEFNSQKILNALEQVDRLEAIMDNLRKQCQIEFLKWKDGITEMEQKLEYQLRTMQRDLQDNIDACRNSIGLVDKKIEHLPYASSRSGKSDAKIIGDHFMNLTVSLLAFLMLLISSGVQVLIRSLNLATNITQGKSPLLLLIVFAVVIIFIAMKFSWFSKLPLLTTT